MTHLTLEQILIFNLKQKLSEGSMAYMKKDEAYLTLRSIQVKILAMLLKNGKSGLKTMVYLFCFVSKRIVRQMK